jgi:hypothetical protein
MAEFISDHSFHLSNNDHLTGAVLGLDTEPESDNDNVADEADINVADEADMTIDIANLKVSGTVTVILINQSFPAHLFTSYLPHYTESVEFSRFCWIPPPCLIIWYSI